MRQWRSIPSPPGHAGNVALPWLPAMQTPTVEAALRDVDSTKVRFRRDAAFALRNAVREQVGPAVAALRRLLDDPDQAVRALAVESLGALRDTAALDDVLRKVDDPDENVRVAAVEAAAALACDRPSLLLHLFRHEKPDVRAAACTALPELGGPEIEEAVVEALADDAPQVRAAAASMLGWCYPRRYSSKLRRALRDPDPQVRLAAADVLSWVGDDCGREVLLELVRGGARGEDWELAFGCLARIAHPEDAPLLAAHGKWPANRRRRALALAGLARLGDSSARAQFKKWISSTDVRRRAEALLAVGVAGATEYWPELEHEIARPESPLFGPAVYAAVQLADRSLAPALVRTARTTADRAVFEDLALAAADLARVLGDAAPGDLVELAKSEFEDWHPDHEESEQPEQPDG